MHFVEKKYEIFIVKEAHSYSHNLMDKSKVNMTSN